MDPDRTNGLARRIANLDPARRASLAAAVYRKRGWSIVDTGPDQDGDPGTSVEADDRRLTVRRPTDQRNGQANRPTRSIVLSPSAGRSDRSSSSSTEVVGPSDLARQIRYALPPAEASRLVDRYDLAPSGPPWVERIRGFHQRAGRTKLADPLRLTGLVVLTAALLVAGALGSPNGSDPAPAPASPAGTVDTPTATTPTAIPVTAVPLSADEMEGDTDRSGEDPIRRPRHEDEAVAAYCPEPPEGVSPSALAPAVGPNASRLVLQAWDVRGNSTIADFDAASAAIRNFPSTRWVGTYVSPGGQLYHVAIDRWSTPAAARRSYLGFDGAGHAAIVWGAYVIRVDGYDRSGELLSGARGTAEARILVMAISVPGTDRTLGTGCAKTLMGNPP